MDNLPRWETPESYGGFNPVGDYVIAIQYRDCEVLHQSNYQCLFKLLEEKAEELGCLEGGINGEGDEENMVYDFRAKHWAVGWVETLLICQNAPQELLDYALEQLTSLEDYPVVDEEHFSEMEYEKMQSNWDWLDLADKVDICRKSGVSIFSARNESPPYDCRDYLIG